MKISQKGLYALQAMMMLARHYQQGAIKIRDIAYEENLPEKFLELILLELKNARIVESARGAKGGYQLRRPPSEIRLSEVIRLTTMELGPTDFDFVGYFRFLQRHGYVDFLSESLKR